MIEPQKLELLNRVREALRKPELFDSLSQHRDEIADLLEAYDLELNPAEEALLDEDPRGIERLYEFLAERDAPADREVSEALRLALAKRDADETSIGLAFKNGLCRDLGDLADPTSYFEAAGLRPLLASDNEWVQMLLSRKDVAAAQPAIEPLVRFGLTPMSVYLTCDAPRTLALRRRMTDTLIIPTVDHPIESRPGNLSVNEVAWEATSLDDGESIPHYRALLAWLADIQRKQNGVRQYMFRGYTTVVEAEDLRLTPVGGNQLADIDPGLQWEPQPALSGPAKKGQENAKTKNRPLAATMCR